MAGDGRAHARIRAVGTRAWAKLGLSAAISVLPVKTNVFVSSETLCRRNFLQKAENPTNFIFRWKGEMGKIDIKNKPPNPSFC